MTITADAFEPLCTAPCEVNVPAGSYYFGVSQNGDPPRRADDMPIVLGGERDALTIRYDDRSVWRVLGWVSWVGGLLAVGGLGVLGLTGGNYFEPEILAPSITIAVTTTILWAALAYLEDSATVRRTGR